MRRRKVRAAKLIADGLWVDLRGGSMIRYASCVWELPMPTTFRAYQPDQPLLLPPDLQEWVPPGHLAHHVSDVVNALDLTAFYAPYEGDGRRNAVGNDRKFPICKDPKFLSAPRRRVTPVEEGSTQTVVGLIW